MTWYYNNDKTTKMCCSFCVKDNQFSIVTNTESILAMSQTVTCEYCNWCPKIDGLIRPSSKTSGYISKINMWNTLYGKYPDKIKIT